MSQITLEQIAELAAGITPAKIKIVREDYDEYGAEQYVQIFGECACLTIYYGPASQWNCYVDGYYEMYEGEQEKADGGEFESYLFSTKEEKLSAGFPIWDIKSVGEWIKKRAKYLKASPDLFERNECIKYPVINSAGEKQNATYKDYFVVCDEDFYIDGKAKKTRMTRVPDIDYDDLPDPEDELK